MTRNLSGRALDPVGASAEIIGPAGVGVENDTAGDAVDSAAFANVDAAPVVPTAPMPNTRRLVAGAVKAVMCEGFSIASTDAAVAISGLVVNGLRPGGIFPVTATLKSSASCPAVW